MAFLKLKPSCKDYLWGGTRLRTEFGIEYDRDPLAESWELSCHPDGPSYIVNGEYAGKTLQQYIDENGKEILGTDCQSFEQFPVLIKFIDAKKDLSIQVHPDNTYALKNEGQYGKTEMWYVMDAAEGASLFYGFAKEVSEEEFEERIRNHTDSVEQAMQLHPRLFQRLPALFLKIKRNLPLERPFPHYSSVLPALRLQVQ